jgi:hypothetical protein
MALQHAVIEIDEKDQCPTLPNSITVQFNPTEYTLSKGAQIAEIAIPGIDSPILQFVRGQTETLSLELFFDTTEQGVGEDAVDVRDQTKWVYQLVKIQPDRHAPPRVRIIWGQGLSFGAIVESVQQKFTLFTPLGIPVRATLTVAFKEYKTLEDQLTELNLKSADHSKEVVVKARKTLPQIAYEEYGDPAQWRWIAEAKGNRDLLPNPARLVPGTRLLIPAIDVLAAGQRQSR